MNVCRLGRKRKRNSVIIHTIMVTMNSSCGNKVTTFICSILYNFCGGFNVGLPPVLLDKSSVSDSLSMHLLFPCASQNKQ